MWSPLVLAFVKYILFSWYDSSTIDFQERRL